MKQRRIDAHAVEILLANATVEALKGKTPWMATLLENMGMNALAALIVREGAKPKPKGRKVDLLLQVGVLWDTKRYIS